MTPIHPTTAMPRILVQGTHGAEDPEKATLPFVIGNVSATADQDTVVFLTSEAVRLATQGYADDISFGGHPPASEMLAKFVANGGRVWPAEPAPALAGSPKTTSSRASAS